MGIRVSKDSFLMRANIKYNNLYDYSQINFIDMQTPVTIFCLIHGNFLQTPTEHLSKKRVLGCKKCANEASSKRRILGQEKVINRLKDRYNNFYNYDNSIYLGMHKNIDIICPLHGKFSKRVGNHLNGHACSKCSTRGRPLTEEDLVILRFKGKHKNIYDYENVKFAGMLCDVEIICREHGSFHQTPVNHLHGSGCPDCALTGFNQSKPGILYYLKDIVTGYYKIGITNRTIKKRFGTKIKDIEILKIWEFKDGSDVYELEQFLHSEFSNYRLMNENFIGYGATEFFNRDVLNLDS